jgi:hypothetical protein
MLPINPHPHNEWTDKRGRVKLRPVFHCLEHHIRAHVVVCWLALLLIRLAERKTGQTWRRIATELSRLHLVTPPRPGRQLPADHPAHRRPTRDPRRARHRTATTHHRARARLTPPLAGPCGVDTRLQLAQRRETSQAASDATECPSTAELGAPLRVGEDARPRQELTVVERDRGHVFRENALGLRRERRRVDRDPAGLAGEPAPAREHGWSMRWGRPRRRPTGFGTRVSLCTPRVRFTSRIDRRELSPRSQAS